MEEKVYSTNVVALQSRKRYNKLSKEKRLDWSRVSNNNLTRKFEADPEFRKIHLERQKIATGKTLNKIPEGLCKASLKCKKQKLENSMFCLEHWIRSIARAYSDNKNRRAKFNHEEVISLWYKQNGRCAITGIDIIPGLTASLDHIVVVSKGGTNDVSNLRFVHKNINMFKKDYSDQEFKELIKTISVSLLEWAYR